jgi:hypothetical protein
LASHHRTSVIVEPPYTTVALQEVDRVSVTTVSPHQSGFCGTVSQPTHRCRADLCWTCRASGVGPGSALSVH